MSSQLTRTKTPGIYRRGTRYVVKQRDRRGRWHTATAATMAEARARQAELRVAAAAGTLRASTRARFNEYALEWIDTYTGRTSRGFRESTRTEYRRALRNHAIPYFGQLSINEITPRDIKAYARHCAEKGLGRHGVKNALGPVKAMLATAFEDGDIPVNPSANVRMLTQQTDPDAPPAARALSPDELTKLLDAAPADCRLVLAFLARTGLRIGELIALEWRDLDLVGDSGGRVHVRRAHARGVTGLPKSRFGVRTVPISADLRTALVQHRLRSAFSQDTDLVFASEAGTILDVYNLRNRVMRPAAKAAGVPWASFHSLRHTFASICFRHGCNAKQVQMLLGHHAASFTLDTYIHAIPDDLPDLDFLSSMASLG